jgi:hypothetical protein
MDLDDDLPTADVDRIAERRREARRAREEAGGVILREARGEDDQEDPRASRRGADTGALADR